MYTTRRKRFVSAIMLCVFALSMGAVSFAEGPKVPVDPVTGATCPLGLSCPSLSGEKCPQGILCPSNLLPTKEQEAPPPAPPAPPANPDPAPPPPPPAEVTTPQSTDTSKVTTEKDAAQAPTEKTEPTTETKQETPPADASKPSETTESKDTKPAADTNKTEEPAKVESGETKEEPVTLTIKDEKTPTAGNPAPTTQSRNNLLRTVATTENITNLPGDPDLDEGGEGDPESPSLIIHVSSVSVGTENPTVGQPCTLTATYTGVAESSAPTGSIAFNISGTQLTAAATTSGSASVEWTPTTDGSFDVSAVYAPGAEDAYTASGKGETTITVLGEDAPPPPPTEEDGEGEEDPPPVEKRDISVANVTVVTPEEGFEYVGKQITPDVSVTDTLDETAGEQLLAKGTDYEVSYGENTEAGTGTVTITGIGDYYTGTREETFTITKGDASGWSVSVDEGPYTFDGEPIEPTVTVLDGGTVVDKEDYEAVYEGNDAPGTARVMARGVGNFEGVSLATTFAINEKALNTEGFTVTLKDAAYESGGVYYYKETNPKTFIKPVPVVTENGTALDAANYTVAYDPTTGCDTAGQTGKVTVTGTGTYSGTVTVNYAIIATTSTFKATLSPATFAYTGEAQTPKPTVVDASDATKTLVLDTDYTLEYKNNTNATGTTKASVMVIGKGATYANSVEECQFEITKLNTTLALNTEVVGGNLVMTATIGGGKTPTGTIKFTITSGRNTVTTKEVAVSNARGQHIIPIVSSSSYTVAAEYIPDANHNGSTAQDEVVHAPNVRVSITGTGVMGDYATILVTVSGNANGPTPTGWVRILIDGNEIAEMRLDRNGQASHTLWNYAWQRASVVAVYDGDTYYTAARSKETSIWDDDKLSPTIALKSSVSNSSKTATLTATVSGRSYYYWYREPTGYVAFYSENGNKHLGTVKLDSNGEAVFTWKSIANGTHTVYAVYQGDDYFRSVSASDRFTIKASSSGSGSGSGSGSSGTGTGGSQAPVGTDIRLRDVNGNILSSYNTANLTMQSDGVILLETTESQEFYGYGFSMTKLSEYARTAPEGYFNIVTPDFNIHMPYDLASGMEGLTAYLQEKNLSQSSAELRVSIRAVEDSALLSAYNEAYPGTGAARLFRIEVALYNAAGSKMDYVPDQLTQPMELLVSISGESVDAQGYNEQTRSFFPVGLEVGNNVASVTVDQNAIYIIGE